MVADLIVEREKYQQKIDRLREEESKGEKYMRDIEAQLGQLKSKNISSV